MYEAGIDVVVVNYKTPHLLQDFIASLVKYTPSVPINCTIFNVAPDYESYRYAEVCKKVGITHLWNPENIGYASAVNQAVAKMDRECIAIFNSDTYFTSNILDECFDQLMSHSDWGVLGPKQINQEGMITSGGVVGTNANPQLRWWQQPDGADKAIIDENCLSVSGSAYFIKRALWEVITEDPDYIKAHKEVFDCDPLGAFPLMHHYFEEMSCSHMARNIGQKVVYYGQCSMVHLWHQSSKVGSDVDQRIAAVKGQYRKLMDAMGIEHE